MHPQRLTAMDAVSRTTELTRRYSAEDLQRLLAGGASAIPAVRGLRRTASTDRSRSSCSTGSNPNCGSGWSQPSEFIPR